MKSLFISLILCGISILGFSQQWVKTYTGYNYIFKAMDFPGGQSTTGFAGGQSVTYMGDGIVIKTTNGGNTWTSLWTGTDQGIEGMSFPDLQTGYVCGWSAYFAKTTNGGTSWTVQSPGTDVDYYTDVAFKDPNNGVVSATTGSGMGIWVTSNGGTSWTPGSGLTGIPYKLVYVTGNTYFLVTNGGDIQKSTDNGLTWTVSYDGSGLLLGIDFYNSNTGIAAGEDGRILKTYDGGATWQQQIIAYGNPLWHDFAWADANNVIAAGTPETIWRSTDGGANWSDDYPQSTYDPALYEAIYTNDGIAYVIGSQGWFYKKAPLLTAGFTASQTTICSGTNVQFTDQSVGNPTSWNWTFEGGNPPTSTLQNPIVNYPVPGVYDVTLTIFQGSNSNTYTSADMIHVDGTLLIAPQQPAGAAELCSDTPSQFTTTVLSGATSYAWSVSPSNAGVITGTGLTGTFTGSSTYAGQYAITVKGVNACGQSPASQPLSATLFHKPLEYSIYAGGGYCIGGPGVEIKLEDSETGVDYQLYNYFVPVGTPLPGTGGELSFGLQPEGVYSITGVNGICSTDMLGLAEVFIILPPSAASAPSGPTSVCNSDSSVYTAAFPQGSLSLAWTLTPAGAGTIEEISYNTIRVSWNSSFTGEALLEVAGVNDCGIGTSSTLAINVDGAPVPVISGDELSCINYTEIYSIEETTGTTYNWTVAGGIIIQGQGTPEITVNWSTAGTAEIKVTVTNTQGCQNTSEGFNVNVMLCTYTASPSAPQVRVFPNPATSIISIDFNGNTPVSLRTEIYNSTGIYITEKLVYDNRGEYIIDISDLPSGLYFMRLTGNNYTTTTRFTKIQR